MQLDFPTFPLYIARKRETEGKMEPLLYHWKLDAALPFRIDFQHLEKQFENPRRDMHAAVQRGLLLAGDLGTMREPYDFYWTASWEIHGGLKSENGAGLLLITFSPEILLNAVIGDKSPVRALLYLPFREKASLFRTPPVRKMTERLKIDLETMRKRDAPQQKIWLRIVDFVCDLAAALPRNERRKCPQERHELLMPVFEKLASLPRSPLTAAEASALCGMSESGFYRLFRDFTGLPFSSYELYFRLNCAAEELCRGELSIKQAAAEWGFFDTSHFSRAFKKQFGVSPSDYCAAGRKS